MSPFYLPLGPRAPLPITITKFVAAIPRSYPVGPVTRGDSQKDATEMDSVARHILVKYSNVTSILLYGVGSQCKSSALAVQSSLETPPLRSPLLFTIASCVQHGLREASLVRRLRMTLFRSELPGVRESMPTCNHVTSVLRPAPSPQLSFSGRVSMSPNCRNIR